MWSCMSFLHSCVDVDKYRAIPAISVALLATSYPEYTDRVETSVAHVASIQGKLQKRRQAPTAPVGQRSRWAHAARLTCKCVTHVAREGSGMILFLSHDSTSYVSQPTYLRANGLCDEPQSFPNLSLDILRCDPITTRGFAQQRGPGSQQYRHRELGICLIPSTSAARAAESSSRSNHRDLSLMGFDSYLSFGSLPRSVSNGFSVLGYSNALTLHGRRHRQCSPFLRSHSLLHRWSSVVSTTPPQYFPGISGRLYPTSPRVQFCLEVFTCHRPIGLSPARS